MWNEFKNDTSKRDLCDMNELVKTGTIFPHKDIHKATWKSPDGVTRNQTDHILVRLRLRSSVEFA